MAILLALLIHASYIGTPHWLFKQANIFFRGFSIISTFMLADCFILQRLIIIIIIIIIIILLLLLLLLSKN